MSLDESTPAAAAAALSAASSFVAGTGEKAEYNQYWYSPATIAAVVREVAASSEGRVAFLSTPSIFFSIPEAARAGHTCFDIDEQWAATPGCAHYDFKHPEALDGSAHMHAYDMVVIDPPFITEEVWRLYADAALKLLKHSPLPTSDAGAPPLGRVIASTVYENEGIMASMLNAKPQRFLPSIPHLVYQYRFYCNFDTRVLCAPNPEVPDFD